MARAKAAALEDPFDGVKRTVSVASDAVTSTVQATVKATSKGLYGAFYYTSFGVTSVLLSVFRVLLIGDNPIGSGIKDGALAAGGAGRRKRTKR